MGIHHKCPVLLVKIICFNRRWRFLGGDTARVTPRTRYLLGFQSQVAILGWGYVFAIGHINIIAKFQSQV